MPTEEKPCEGIYFLSLTLENVRCFGESQTLELSDGNGKPAQWIVMLGDNGTGKTTLLQTLFQSYLSVDFFLDEDEQRVQKRSSSPRFLRRKKSDSMSIEAQFAHGFSFSNGIATKERSYIKQDLNDFFQPTLGITSR